MEQIAIALLMWIGANSGYSVAGIAPPAIVLFDQEALAALAHVESGAPQLDPRVLGFYQPSAGGTIHLVHPAETPGAERHADPADNPLFRERLLHELVHHVQHAGGVPRKAPCPARNEFDAYRLGGLYLRQQGVSDPLPNREMVARFLSRCWNRASTARRRRGATSCCARSRPKPRADKHGH